MSKTAIDRLNQTITHDWPPQLFQGLNTNVIRKIIVRKLKDHFSYAEQVELSEIMSFGGRGLFRSSRTTETRHLKRLVLLFHRVLGYHTAQETAALRRTIEKLDDRQTMIAAAPQIQRGIGFLRNRSAWAREIPQRLGGRLVHYYSQGEDDRLQQMDLTENGWCLGMSVQWLADKAARTDFWSQHGKPEAGSKYRFVMVGQKLRTMGAFGSNMDDRASFRLRRYGLTKVATTVESGDPSAEKLARNIATSPTSFCRIGQYYVSGGGHAMAAYVHAGGVYFMDPNLGEFFFADHIRFRQWFPLFTRFMGYVFRKHYVEHFREDQRKISSFLADALRARREGMGYETA